MLRVLSLHYDRRAPVQELTKCYWHFTFGNNAFAGNHRSLLLRLLRKHEKVLQLYGPGNSVTHEEKSSLTCSTSLLKHRVEGKREQIPPSSTVYSPVISLIHVFIEHTVGSLRKWGCSERPLAEGKARVRWRCVSGPQSSFTIEFVLRRTCRSVVVGSMMISTNNGPAQQRHSKNCLTKVPSSVLSSTIASPVWEALSRLYQKSFRTSLRIAHLQIIIIR